MDIKNSYDKYPTTCGVNVNLEDIKESISILMNSSIDYEFRTTVVKEFHNIEDFHQIGQMIKGAKNYFLQSYQNKESVIDKMKISADFFLRVCVLILLLFIIRSIFCGFAHVCLQFYLKTFKKGQKPLKIR